MKSLGGVMPNCKRAGVDDMVIKTIPNLMSATVVEFSKGTQHTSDNHLQGYFALHRLFLWAINTYPDLQDKIDTRLANFIDDQALRKKNKCPHIGEWLMLLAGSAKYRLISLTLSITYSGSGSCFWLSQVQVNISHSVYLIQFNLLPLKTLGELTSPAYKLEQNIYTRYTKIDKICKLSSFEEHLAMFNLQT